MSPSFILEAFFWIIAAFWLWTSTRMTRGVLGLRRLPSLRDAVVSQPSHRTVTAVVPVRDGIDEIEATVKQMLAQTG